MKPFVLLGLLLLSFESTPAGDPILIAHRGLLRHAPENTIPAFAACLELGMGFELDIRTTRDGKLVVLHDATLGRTTNGPDEPLTGFGWDEISELDAGSWFHPRFAGLRIPSLEETFELIRQRKRGPTIIALNVKHITEDGERELQRLLARFDLFEESFAFDQSEECSRRLEAIDPRIRIGRNVGRGDLKTRLDEDSLDVFLLTFVPTSEEMDLLREKGKQVLFNYAGEGEHRRNEATWLQAREVGIDGMLTDYPLDCAKILRTAAPPEAAIRKSQLEVIVSPRATVVEREGITGGGTPVKTEAGALSFYPNHPDDFGDSSGTGSAVSTDGGRTWKAGEDNWPIPQSVSLWADRLDNGDLLAFGIHWLPDPEKRRDPTLPEVPADAYEIALSTDEGLTWKRMTATIDCPPDLGVVARPLPHIREWDGGLLLMPAYTWSKGGNRAVLLESADRGRNWKVRSVITTAVAMIQAGAKVTTPWLESTVSPTRDGSLLAIVRSGSSAASHLVSVRSTDGGKTWAPPKVLPFPGKLPTLTRLTDEGPLTLVTALSKHHCRLYVSADGSGESWGDGHVISSLSGSNVGVTRIDSNRLLLATPANRRIDTWTITIASAAKRSSAVKPPANIRLNDDGVLSWSASANAAGYRIQPVLIEPGDVFPEAPILPHAIVEASGDTLKLDLRHQLLPGATYAFEVAAVDREGHVSEADRSEPFER